MLISKNWLQNFFADTLPKTEELSDAITFHAFEIDGIEKKGNDDILDVKVTPNRGHDALSHRGIAGEVSAILKMPLKNDPFSSKPAQNPLTSQAPQPDSAAAPAVSVAVTLEDPALSPRYIAGY